MSDQWYYQAFGQEFGPLAEEEVARMLLTGELTADDTVREGTDGPWRRAGAVSGLMSLVSAVAVETAEVATDIDSFLLVDEQETVQTAPRARETAEDSDFELSPSASDGEEYDENEDDDDQEDVEEIEEEAVWFFQAFGTELGPVPLSELVKLVERGELGASDAIRMGTTGDWITAGEIPALFPNQPNRQTTAQPRPAAAGAGATAANQYSASRQDPAAQRRAPTQFPVQPVQPAGNAARTQPLVGAPTAWTAPAAAVDVNWYCYVDEHEMGPMGIIELQGLAATGKVTAEVYVKYGGQGEWLLASEVPNLLPSEQAAPATPSQVVFVPVAAAAPAAPAPLNLADAERSELVQQLFALLKKEGLQTSLMGQISTAAPLTGAGWYCDISGSVMGPVSIEALVQMVLQKRIFPDDLIRLGDSGEWFPAKTVPDLFPDTAAGKGKKSGLDDGQSVMDRIDQMYREAQEAKAKAEAANGGSAPAKSVGSEPSRTRKADDLLREMNAKMARGKTDAELAAERAEKLEEFFGGLKLDRRSLSVLGVIAVIGLGYLLLPILLEDVFAGQSFDQLVKINLSMLADQKKGIDAAAWEKKSKDLIKTIDQIAKSVRGGKAGSAKRDVARMANYLKEMVRAAAKKSPSSTGEDDYSRAQKHFEDYQKAAKKKLGRK